MSSDCKRSATETDTEKEEVQKKLPENLRNAHSPPLSRSLLSFSAVRSAANIQLLMVLFRFADTRWHKGFALKSDSCILFLYWARNYYFPWVA